MYSFKNIFTQEPNAVREAVLLILGALVVTDVVSISADAVAAIGLAVSSLLGLFYVRPLTASKSALRSLTTSTKKKK